MPRNPKSTVTERQVLRLSHLPRISRPNSGPVTVEELERPFRRALINYRPAPPGYKFTTKVAGRKPFVDDQPGQQVQLLPHFGTLKHLQKLWFREFFSLLNRAEFVDGSIPLNDAGLKNQVEFFVTSFICEFAGFLQNSSKRGTIFDFVRLRRVDPSGTMNKAEFLELYYNEFLDLLGIGARPILDVVLVLQ